MEHSEPRPIIKPVYSLKSVVLVLLRLAAFTYGLNQNLNPELTKDGQIDPCPDGFTLHGEICFKGIDDVDFETAKKTCSDLDARVAEPRSPEENKALFSMMSSTNYGFIFLGASPASTPGQWKWNSDRRLMTWTNWDWNYPRSTADGKCIVMREVYDKDGNSLGKWKNSYCFWKESVICLAEKQGGKNQTGGEQKTGEQEAEEDGNTFEGNKDQGNSPNSSETLSVPSFLLSVCLSTVAMMQVF